MSVQTSVKLPDELRARLDRAAALAARDRSALIIEALDQYLARFVSPEEVVRQCRAANEADASDDWEAFVELDLGGPDSVDLDYRAVLASSRA